MESLDLLIYATLPSQLELLNTVLISTETFDDISDEEPLDLSDTEPVAKETSTLMRRVGTMKSLSGADNMAYIEMNTSAASGSGRMTSSGLVRKKKWS